jgi:aspartyl-tRNA(Asn)/glutamyl-tRNA(Gln) amidotransferase subunit B
MSAPELTPTIGLEVHMHLATRTKLFCGCEVAYDARPNSRVCPVCLGMPGVLPVMNEKAVELAVRMALALGCTIPDLAKWDRKHYYYPDLPKNYQISEYDQPLGVDGYLDITTSAGTKRVGIIRVHLEEDAGKLMHAEGGGNYSVVDLNRTGTPLLEVVSEPDIRSAEEARAYGEALRQLAVYLGVSGCNMQLGQMRFEPNISLRIGTDEQGRPRYTPISEIKNLNSFRSVERAVAYELARHREEYEADPKSYTLEHLGKETRGWRDTEETTFLQRSKEEAHDYRYFPEPDLAPFVPDRKWVERLKQDLPKLPAQFRKEMLDAGVPVKIADALLQESQIAKSWRDLVFAIKSQPEAKPWEGKRAMELAHNWILQDVRRELNERGISLTELRSLHYAEEELARLIVLVETGVINRNVGTEVFRKMLETGKSAAQIVQDENLAQVADTGALEKIVDQVLAANEKTAADYRGGRKAAFGRLMGEAMKASGGKANPQVVKDLLTKKLGG